MKYPILITLFSAMILAGCIKRKITKVTLASSGCHGECPVMAIELNSSLNVKYYGGEFSKNKGFYTANISNNLWNDLSDKLLSIDLDKVDSTYDNNNDYDYYELVINSNKEIRIKGYLIEMPDDLKKVIKDILNVQSQLLLKKSRDSLYFESDLQYSKPIVIQPKFPPPQN